jgi:hypothetical protein
VDLSQVSQFILHWQFLHSHKYLCVDLVIV